ncbi:translation initiation factor IF-3 [Salmonella sp. NW1263]|uniref:translation initiation factor IF-3 n=1 Tax=Salmonella sp. NW1263 TaxID=2947700 RepID=UPI003F6BE1D0
MRVWGLPHDQAENNKNCTKKQRLNWLDREINVSSAAGDKAKISLRFRGREMAHQELGMELLKRVEADLAEYGTVEQHPKMEGRQLMMVIAPKKKK